MLTSAGPHLGYFSRTPTLCRNDSAIARALAQALDEDEDARRRAASSAARPRRPPASPLAASKRRAAAEARLARRLRSRNLRGAGVRGDGACMFRALADQMWGDEGGHAAVRRAVVAELASRPALYAPFVAAAPAPPSPAFSFAPAPASYAAYVNTMAQQGAWGDHVSLKAACNAFGLKAVLVTSFGDEEEEGAGVVVVEPSPPPPQQQQQQQQQAQQQQPAQHARVVHLSYLGDLHYDSLRARPPPAKKVLGSRKLGRLLMGGGAGA